LQLLANITESTLLDHTLQQLEIAADGLLVPSETDCPFSIYTYSLLRKQLPAPPAVLRKLELNPEVPVETTSIEEFFDPLVAAMDTDDAARERWQQLVETVRSCLDPVLVYRVGSSTVDVLILGVVEGGGVAGLRTSVVET